MSWGFEEGKVYNRRTDIHARLGGQQQGGIVTPSHNQLVIIITGEEGLAHGYDDRTRDDGVFEYFGEGQVGDMLLQRGNLAIASHAADGKSLLLFRKTKDGLRFLAEMVYEKHHVERAPDRDGNQRNAIVFELRPLSAINEMSEEDVDNEPLKALGELRRLAKAAAGIYPPTAAADVRSIYQRRSQLIDATLYLRGKRWSVGWNGDFIEVLPRQKRRNYGTVGSAGSH